MGAVRIRASRSQRAQSRSAGRGGIPVGRVLASDNGATFRTLVTLPGAQLYRGGPGAHVRVPRDDCEVLSHRVDRRAAHSSGRDEPGAVCAGEGIHAARGRAAFRRARPPLGREGRASVSSSNTSQSRRLRRPRSAIIRSRRHRRPDGEDEQRRHAQLGCAAGQLDRSCAWATR